MLNGIGVPNVSDWLTWPIHKRRENRDLQIPSPRVVNALPRYMIPLPLPVVKSVLVSMALRAGLAALPAACRRLGWSTTRYISNDWSKTAVFSTWQSALYSKRINRKRRNTHNVSHTATEEAVTGNMRATLIRTHHGNNISQSMISPPNNYHR